jgi:hypothetical protein
MRPLLLLTVDVEEDMPEWRITHPTTVENARSLPKLAAVCEELGVRPTYLCTYPIVRDEVSAPILRELGARADTEIGTHLHPWNTPPFEGVPGRDGDERTVPYFQFELGPERFRRKLEALHAEVTELAGAAPTAFRAGRFGLDAATLRELLPFGYVVDSSVTPLEDHVYAGGGPDFRRAPAHPYRPHTNDVSRVGDLDIVEIPVSVGLTRSWPGFLQQAYVHLPAWTHVRGLLSRDFLHVVDFAWLYPARFELGLMQDLTATLARAETPIFNVFLHSNELHVGTSGRVASAREAEGDACIERTRQLLAHCLEEYDAEPVTLTEAARRVEPGLPAGRRA